MFRDFKFLKRKQNEAEAAAVEEEDREIENFHVNVEQGDTASSLSSVGQSSVDRFGSARPPLNAILPDQVQPPNPRSEGAPRSKSERTPTKPKARHSDLPLRTPDRFGVGGGGGGFPKPRFGWGQRGNEEPSGLPSVTPRSTTTMVRGAGKASSECNSTQSTPTKSVSKPSVGRPAVVGRPSNGGALYRGFQVSGGVNSVEVPHFELKEDPSFWMDHNVQVLIRVRPLNSSERSTNGYSRCFRQESPQTITWIGQPETRFTFDHVACESIDQELLFRMAGLPMVENCLSGYNSCIFAYGQTGSGKTYTMLGDIDNLEFKPSPNRGMTPRIFEFLFARIQAEEESRRDERLKYNCKCSFLEIYNEQITDLLDPSSSNLLLREDAKTGVYVENLSEFEVHNVSDILKLLTQGSLNRKVASTNMNRESSRSHCVFTCAIESTWEKDSTTNLRFARLNLVDLAGSERQKSSGAEGERLKEAANINKSLSTLGHVIMILVDVANGKQRHVPYRDSRLTFLLQDSLGGNSKTMIIANVSPSICCAAETLNTLKFAQRAKLIQNNAVVNEDSTGDVAALQHQIRLLKDELSLLKRQNVARPLSFCTDVEPAMHEDDDHGIHGDQVDTTLGFESRGNVMLSTKQIRALESTLAGALRREQMAETTMKKLEAEIEHLNRLVRQREEETQSIKMMLRFREDKIQRMESLVGSSLTSDAYLTEENRSLSKEIQLLQAKVDKNPEVTRFALENIRLLDQLRRFQEFYEEGERTILLDEVANLRAQLFQFVDRNTLLDDFSCGRSESQLKDELNELEVCRSKFSSCLEDNKSLRRELHDLHVKLENLDNGICRTEGNVNTAKDPSSTQHSEDLMGKEAENNLKGVIPTSVVNHGEDILDLQLEVDILKIILKEERSSHAEAEYKASSLNKDLELAEAKLLSLRKNFDDTIDELKENRVVMAALESQQILAIEEMEELRKINFNYEMLLAAKEQEIMSLKNQVPLTKVRDHPASNAQSEFSSLHRKLKRMQDSLEKAKRVNTVYQNDYAFQTSNEEEMDKVRRQAEAETVEAIVCMEEELCILQQQVHDCNLKEIQTKQAMSSLETELQELQKKLGGLGEDNEILRKKLEERDMELRIYSEEWELLSCEMEEVLSDGQDAITDAAQQLDLITSSLPQRRIWISENVGRLSRLLSQKDMLIDEFGRCLEEANTKRVDLEFKVQSLRGAAMVINEAQQKECREREKAALMLKSQLTEKMSCILELEEKAKLAELEAFRASTSATVAFIIVNHLSELKAQSARELKAKDIQLRDLTAVNSRKEVTSADDVLSKKAAEEVIQCLRSEIVELRNACGTVEQKLSVKERHARNLEQMLEDLEHNDLTKMREKLTELSAGILSLKSCVGIDVGSGIKFHEVEAKGAFRADDFGSTSTDAGEGLRNISDSSPKISRGSLLDDESALGCSSDVSNAVLMKKEIGLALDSFQELQMVVIKQLDERNELLTSEKQYKESMESFATELFSLEAGISKFGRQFDSSIGSIEQKLLSFEHSFHEALTRWGQAKEAFELEIGDTKLYSVQKAAEASCIYAKFEEAQETLKEADIMLNELMIANEKTKLDKDRMKRMENRLTDERDKLKDQVQNLQSVNDLKDKHIRDIEEQYGTELMQMRNLTNELESVILQLQNDYEESFSSIVHDFQGVETQISDYGKEVKSWIGDIWSEIIGKDCAISVLHLCHMGVLLETITGLNAENFLLHHGLCESDSVIADLRTHNFKTSKELEMFRSLKGKLLVDIKGGFERISRKEEEVGQLCNKLTSFEKMILDLQHQEELMLQRADHMGSQLAVLMEDLDLSNRKFVESLSDQDKMLQDKEDLFNAHVELFTSNLLSKELELCVMESVIEEMDLQKAASQKDLLKYCCLLENLKKELIVSDVDSELKGRELLLKEAQIAFLHKQVEEGQKEAGKMLSMLTDVAQLNSTLRGELAECVETKVRMADQIHALEFEKDTLEKDLKSNLFTLEELGCKEVAMQRESARSGSLLEKLKQNTILWLVDKGMHEQLLVLEEAKVEILENTVEKAQQESLNLSSRLDESNLINTELENAMKSLKREIMSLNNVSQARDDLISELKEVTEAKETFFSRVQELALECEKLRNDLNTKETISEVTSSHLLDMGQQKQQFEANICVLESLLNKLKTRLNIKDLEISRISCVEEENKSLRCEVDNLRNENILILQDLEKKNSEMESSLKEKDDMHKEDLMLRERILFLEIMLTGLQGHFETKKAEASKMLHSQSEVWAELCTKRKDLQGLFGRVKTLEEEKASLQGIIGSFKEDVPEVLIRSDNNMVRCIGLVEGAGSVCQKLSGLFREEGFKVIELLLHEIAGNGEQISCFMEEIERLECDIKELVHHNINLDAELVRKEGILKGLLFDLSLLQESASNSKDQKDKVEEMMHSVEALEEELRVKSGKLDESVTHNQMLETRLQEKIDMISNLESNYAREQESMRQCSSEILELRTQLQDALAANYSLEEDLTEKGSLIEKLEMGLSQMCDDIDKMSQTIDSMRCELSEVTDERDRLNTEISYMKEELEKGQALAEENEAIALEAQQIAESRKMHAEEKEAEVKLLERSVQELECTINVLENKVDILKEEAERQRLQREELEVELLAVNHQMQNVKSSDADTQRILDEKDRDLQQALRRIKALEKDIADMEKEISKCQAHISELNLHAEAQGTEYKQKFKELEAMAEQVKPESNFFHTANSSSNKSEKLAVKSRGSGSPFKCIGLGMVQQMKLEKDEELVSARLHIEELESQAVSRQKEIFALNARLAAAESMTHDVIRDLLGVKLDMSNYVSLLDNQQVQKIAEKAQFSCLEPQAKEQEVVKLQKQLNEFIEERRGWLEEIDRKRAEMIAVQTALEKLRQRDQLLQSEIEVLKMENGNYKKRVMDLEGEVKKLSGQQNLQQRIHHHAKIKEENNTLKVQNEELCAKLGRAEGIMIRVKEELARYRASNGKCPYINFDEERRLMNKLKETEDDRMQLAQKLLAMCTSILKVAGITKPVTEISPAVAEEALEQLNKRITSLERELQDLMHKNRISNERIRLLELRPQASPVNPRTDENYSTPRRNQASFLSDFDR